MKMFNKIIMASEGEVNMLKTGFFYDSDSALDEVEDGALVSIKGIKAHDLYTGVNDLNARIITAYDADAPIYGVVDYVGVSHADVMGVNYRVGDKIAGVYPTAGEATRVRMLALGDEFYLGNENFSGTPAKGKFAKPQAGETTWLIDNAKPQTGLAIEIEDVRPLIMGQVNEGTNLYRCRVVQC